MTLQIDIYQRGANKMIDKILELAKQRRIWATLLSVVAVVGISLGQPQIAQVCTAIAGALGLTSYLAPKD